MQLNRAALLLGVLASHLIAFAQSATLTDAQIEGRTDAIVTKLTLTQKIDLLGGEDSFYVHAEPTVGLPRIKMSDASVGVRVWGPATAYPATIALAASWDTELANRLGVSIGQDSRARGVHIMLGPGVNIYRAPMNGRNFEYLGEDPYLASRLAVNWIEGVQSQGVSATVKHFAANNSEYARNSLSSDIDERTLREIYLPAFEASVKEAHVGTIMDSYNLLNGVHTSQDDWLNNQLAKREWGFKGIMMSDWGAAHDLAVVDGGLDLEMPSAQYMSAKNLLPGIDQGKVSMATIDEKVRRIVRTEVRFGWLDRAQQDDSIPLESAENRSVALQAAREGIVLLKNDNSLLPLDPKSICTLAVIGPNAWPATTGGGGSSHVNPFHAVSLMSGIADYLDGPRAGVHAKNCPGVLYDRGLPTNDEMFRGTAFSNEGKSGLKQEIFTNAGFIGSPLSESMVDHLTARELPHPPSAGTAKVSIRWTGDYIPETTGKYLLMVSKGGPAAYRVLVNGRSILESAADSDEGPRWTSLDAVAGKPVQIELDSLENPSGVRIGLGISSVDSLVSERAKAIAAKADAVVVAVGFSEATEGEGYDRSFAMPWGQSELITAMAARNKKIVVTVNGGGGMDMMPWIAEVPALLHLWYAGQEGGRAVAEVLFGEANPEGKLPISIEKEWTDNPVHNSYYPTSGVGTPVPHVQYSEGVFLGYRYYAGTTVKPLFPFGFGLSYTSFAFSHLNVARASTSSNNDDFTVTFDIQNTGEVGGAEVAQLYVSDPSATVLRPVEELKGFKKIRLQPGESAHVELQLDRRSFAYWSKTKHAWTVDPGLFTIRVGDSSDHLPLQTGITLR